MHFSHCPGRTHLIRRFLLNYQVKNFCDRPLKLQSSKTAKPGFSILLHMRRASQTESLGYIENTWTNVDIQQITKIAKGVRYPFRRPSLTCAQARSVQFSNYVCAVGAEQAFESVYICVCRHCLLSYLENPTRLSTAASIHDFGTDAYNSAQSSECLLSFNSCTVLRV